MDHAIRYIGIILNHIIRIPIEQLITESCHRVVSRGSKKAGRGFLLGNH